MVRIMKLAAVVGAVCLLVSPALADYYGGRCYYSRIAAPGGQSFNGNYFQGNGGEFTLRHDGAPGMLLSNAAYHPWTKAEDGNAESFQTFCVETAEFVMQPMDIMVSTTWTNPPVPQWGVGPVAPASHAIKGGMAIGDDLDPQTAYLYYQFAKGLLGGYNYTTAMGNRAASAGALQAAIWFFEEGGGLPGGQGGLWVQEAVDATGLAFGGVGPTGMSGVPVGSWGATIGDVRVLNMWIPGQIGTGYKQDHLWLIPEPAAPLLCALGLGLVSALRRRL